VGVFSRKWGQANLSLRSSTIFFVSAIFFVSESLFPIRFHRKYEIQSRYMTQQAGKSQPVLQRNSAGKRQVPLLCYGDSRSGFTQ
jgi:hypothetical protein